MSILSATNEFSSPESEIRSRSKTLARAKGLILFAWRWLFGAALCMNPLFSIMAVGWAYRFVQGYAAKRWWIMAQEDPRKASFAQFLEDNPEWDDLKKPPNWLVRQNAGERWRADSRAAEHIGHRILLALKTPLHSLWLNLKTGFLGLVNTWILTLPACALWLFAWHAGWNNSFAKMYEQAQAGILTGLLGVALFIAAMMIVPLAQTRQAVAGEWRAFFDFALIWKLVRARWFSCIALAGMYSLLCLPLTFMKMLPAFMYNGPGFEAMTDAELFAFLQRYYFFVCMVGFSFFVFLRIAAARIYTKAVAQCLQDGSLSIERFSSHEQALLTRLNLAKTAPQPERHFLIQLGLWMGRRTSAVVGVILLIAIWFSFVGQIYVSEFFNYHPARAWLNQPLVQAPWFNAIPAHLRNAVEKQNSP